MSRLPGLKEGAAGEPGRALRAPGGELRDEREFLDHAKRHPKGREADERRPRRRLKLFRTR